MVPSPLTDGWFQGLVLAYGPVVLAGLGWLGVRVGRVLREVRDTKDEVHRVKHLAKLAGRTARSAHRRLDSAGIERREWPEER